MLANIGPAVKNLHRGEQGGAYTLSYVMVIPILMLLTCVTIETTLMMNAKVGTTYAAWSAARTAIVWSSASDDWSDVEQRVERAAVQSFVPFASGMGATGDAPSSASAYTRSYAEFIDEPVSQNYIRNKYANAAKELKISIDARPTRHDSDITVTAETKFRFNIPGIGKLIGEKDADGYFFPLESSVTLQNEGPKNDRQEIGIGYGKLD